MTKRLRIDWEPEPDLSWLEQDMFADEDPEDHATLLAVVDELCHTCGEWHVVDSLGNIDFLHSQELPLGTFESRDDLPEHARWIWDDMAVDGVES